MNNPTPSILRRAAKSWPIIFAVMVVGYVLANYILSNMARQKAEHQAALQAEYERTHPEAYGFTFRVVITYQGQDIELKRNISCMPGRSGGMREGGSGLGGGSPVRVAYNTFGNVLPDGSAALVAVPNLCRFATFEMNRAFIRPDGRMAPHDERFDFVQHPYPPTDKEMPMMFWTKDANNLQEVYGYFAPIAYRGPYARFQIKDWSVAPLPLSRENQFDPPDQFWLYELLRNVVGEGKHGEYKPVGYDGRKHSMRWSGIFQRLRTGYYQFDPAKDVIAPWNPGMRFIRAWGDKDRQSPDGGPEKLAEAEVSAAQYGVRATPNGYYSRMQGMCIIGSVYTHSPETQGVACIYPYSRNVEIDALECRYLGMSCRQKADALKASGKNTYPIGGGFLTEIEGDLFSGPAHDAYWTAIGN